MLCVTRVPGHANQCPSGHERSSELPYHNVDDHVLLHPPEEFPRSYDAMLKFFPPTSAVTYLPRNSQQ